MNIGIDNHNRMGSIVVLDASLINPHSKILLSLTANSDNSDSTNSLEIPIYVGQTLKIGRSSENDIVLNDTKVSRFHSVLFVSKTASILTDLSSLNGSFVNNIRISQPTEVYENDKIMVGDTVFQLKVVEQDSTDITFNSSMTQVAELKEERIGIIVSDIINYTKLSEKVPNFDLAKQLNSWFENVGQVIKKHGGEVDKFIGDCVMATWKGDFSTSLLVECALNINLMTEELSLIWPHKDVGEWKVRTSICEGLALFGGMGGKGNRDFTVIGDTVNLAFRINDIAGKLDKHLVISESVYRQLKDSVQAEFLGEFEAQGKEHKVKVYSLN